MSELDPTGDSPNTVTDADDNDDDLDEAYEALAEYRLRQQNEHAVQQPSGSGHRLAEPSLVEAPDPGDALLVDDAEQTPEPNNESDGQPTVEAPLNASLTATAATGSAVADGPTSNRRAFVIDGKEYPDPDPALPITGTRSVQAMYRDYFPGQLDNVDVVQKTRADGTLEVTFKRRIGTKGASTSASRRRAAARSGEVVITVGGVVRVLAALPQDRPLIWDLVEQAIGPDGAVRLDYVPAAAQLNLAEAQQSARVRLIGLAIDELGRLRPRI